MKTCGGNREKKSHGSEERIGARRGSILVLTAVLFMALIAMGALALDFSQVSAKRNALRNVMELMALSAGYEFHMDQPNVENPVHADATPYSQSEKMALRTALGIRAAYNIWQEAKVTRNLIPDNLVADPFGNYNWNVVLSNIKTSNPASFPTSQYNASKIHFLKRNLTTDPLVEATATDLSTMTNYFKVQGASAALQMTGSGLSTILADAVGFEKFLLNVEVQSEIVNSGPTNAVVMLIDRSLAMAVDTNSDAPYSGSTFQLAIDQHMGLTDAEFTAMGLNFTVLQPITKMLYAAAVVPNVLGRSNWFRDDTRRKSFLGVVTYDAVADFPFANVDTDDGQFPQDGFDHNACAGCDNESNAYKEIKTFLLGKTPVRGRGSLAGPDLPQLNVCGAYQAQCRECYTADCSDYSTCGQNQINFMVPSSPRCVNSVYNSAEAAYRWEYPSGASAPPNPFFPWTVSDEGKGMEVAIEMIRQKRRVWIENYGFPQADFKGHIILFSDGWVNAYHDQDLIADSFPSKNGVPCDVVGLADRNIRTGASGVPPYPAPGALVSPRKPIPAGWRISSETIGSEMQLNGVAWAIKDPSASDCQGPQFGTTCPDLYHNGTQKYADVDPAMWPSPGGVVRSPTIDTGLRMARSTNCPGIQCAAALLEYESYTNPDTQRKPGFNFYCPELAFMDFVDWADVNGITTHAVAFGDIKSSYTGSPSENTKRQFLLQYAANGAYAANGYLDEQNKGFFVVKPDCGATGSGCPEFKTALESALVGVEVRLKK